MVPSKSNCFTIRTVFVTLAIVVLLSCNRKESQPQPTNPATLVFSVDTVLVGAAQRDTTLGLLFAPPRGWKRLDERLLRRAEAEALKRKAAQASPGDVRVYYGYIDPETGSVITIARLADFDTSNVSQTIQRYQDWALQVDSSATMKSTVFYHHGMKVHQLLTLSTMSVSFTLVFSSPRLDRPVRFDFVFPSEVYTRFARTIESVLGSVELL
ncbi:MAG TPA: hypothetical protein VNL36_07810 [Bacteroidota bacterium]|nr:hypothetical protein [Bacteroidota bacterium]